MSVVIRVPYCIVSGTLAYAPVVHGLSVEFSLPRSFSLFFPLLSFTPSLTPFYPFLPPPTFSLFLSSSSSLYTWRGFFLVRSFPAATSFSDSPSSFLFLSIPFYTYTFRHQATKTPFTSLLFTTTPPSLLLLPLLLLLLLLLLSYTNFRTKVPPLLPDTEHLARATLISGPPPSPTRSSKQSSSTRPYSLPASDLFRRPPVSLLQLQGNP